MAMWQWSMYIVPRKEVEDYFSTIPDFINEDLFESVEWWKEQEIEEFVPFFNKILPIYVDPWTRNIKHWGSEDGNRIDITYENNLIKSLLILIDLRKDNTKFIKAIVDFTKENEFLIFSFESSRIINPKVSELFDEINQSNKMTFINKPSDFFKNEKYFNELKIKNLQKINKIKE